VHKWGDEGEEWRSGRLEESDDAGVGTRRSKEKCRQQETQYITAIEVEVQ
jgi:hypothetical protein